MDLSLTNIRAKNPSACDQMTSYYARAIQRKHGGVVTPALLRSLARNGYLRFGINPMNEETRRTIIAYLNDVDPSSQLGYGLWSRTRSHPTADTLYYALVGCDTGWPPEVLQMIADICNDQED